MKVLEKFKSAQLAAGLADNMAGRLHRPVVFMEFCGGHTVEIVKTGLRRMLPPHIRLLSGPGCPVCVTHPSGIDKAMAAAKIPGVIVTTFGDMLKVPGSHGSLQDARARGSDVRVVYSAADAVSIARNHPHKNIVFVGIGFETTAPTIAAAVLEAREKNLRNFHLISLQKLCPPIMKEMLNAGEIKLDGILCPGHVSAVIGVEPYEFIPQNYGVACAVSGFEPLDILFSLGRLCEQIGAGRPRVDLVYRRGVRPEGNQTAIDIIAQVFEKCSARWRGFGWVSQSGLKLRQEFCDFDAEAVFDLQTESCPEPKHCICSSILRGIKSPPDCSLFGKRCRPEHPVGPCMVSSEGSCTAFLNYGGNHER